MSSSLKIIKFTSILSAILLLLTYLIGLNIAYCLFDIKWLSNNFLITISGGAFGSSIVVLICEIQKYFTSKRAAEDGLWGSVSLLYSQLLIIKNELDKVLISHNKLGPGILTQPKQVALNALNSVSYIDYTTFKKKQKLPLALQDFYTTKRNLIEYTLQNTIWIDWSINQDTIDNARGPHSELSKSYISETVMKLHEQICIEVDYVEQLLQTIDYDNRYKCSERLKTVKDNYASIMVDSNINDFLSKDIRI